MTMKGKQIAYRQKPKQKQAVHAVAMVEVAVDQAVVADKDVVPRAVVVVADQVDLDKEKINSNKKIKHVNSNDNGS